MQLVSLILIHWIVIYPVDSAIQLLNNWGLACKKLIMSSFLRFERFRIRTLLILSHSNTLIHSRSSIPVFRQKRRKNHIPWCRTYLYGSYKRVFPGSSAVLTRNFSILCRNRLKISLSVFSLALDLLFDCSHVLDYSTRTVLQSSAETISN